MWRRVGWILVGPLSWQGGAPACRYQGHVSAALVLGGVDFRGPHLFTVYPHGSTDALPYATMGSGSLNAMAVFEDEYKCTPPPPTCPPVHLG